jgi:hypothetical protein
LVAIIATIVLSGLAVSMIAVSGARQHESEANSQRLRALYAAEAGVAENIAAQRKGVVRDFGERQAPIQFSGGAYYSSAVDNGDNTTTVQSFATVDSASVGIEAVVLKQGEGPFASALFAGNSGADPLYDLTFGGSGLQADVVNGNVYSGGNIQVGGTAQINGTARADGTISGPASGVTGKALPIPDLISMDYAAHNDFNVASLFSGATFAAGGSLGGKAWQVPEANPAHIFRKNPDDRAANTATTAKDDYFLEDPYESVSTSTTIDPAHGTRITLSGLGGEPGVDGNRKIYYIDGNLWIHNRNIYSFTLFNSGSEGAQATFVVKGNIYFSDNVMYHDPQKDGIAFIAMKDAGVTDSGNIYFGDPVFGTLERMDAFMYAENNFLDTNLSATGSARVTVNGNMTAGNQVRINRDFGAQHSKLTVNYDDRLVTGVLSLPGLPSQSGAAPSWSVLSWRKIAAP